MTEILTAIGGEGENENGGCFKLSFSERIIGAGICALCGLTAGILSIVAVFILNMRKFVVLFTLSNVLFIISICLIVGFKKVCSSFVDKKRRYGGIGMIVGTLLTLFFGLVKKWFILSILSFIVEFISFIYYVLTFIPGGTNLFHFVLK